MSASENAPPTDSDPKFLPPRTVTIGWNASPEQSVAGYHVYTGDSSGAYTGRILVGNQTTVQLEVGESNLYIAVSAYTAEGLESPLSDELIVLATNLEAATTSGGPQIIDNGIH